MTKFNISILIWQNLIYFLYYVHFPKIWQDFGDEQIKIIRKPIVFD